MKTIQPAAGLSGLLQLPGDKSISHRYAMLASIAEGPTTMANYSTGADCHSTLSVISDLGIQVEKGEKIVVHGKGLHGLQAPNQDLDAGNSGTLIRMYAGILAAQPFISTMFGDESLSGRPMDRIINPLAEMGAKISARDGRFPPITIHGGKLNAVHYEPPMASAQVKSAVLLAGIFADGVTTVKEKIQTRDHSELALKAFGADVSVKGTTVALQGRPTLKGLDLTVPGDISSAAFFMVAAMLLPDSELQLVNVGVNPTRASLIDFLVGMGARIKVVDVKQSGGELLAELRVQGGSIKGGVIEKALAAQLIDEIPVLAVLGARSKEGLTVRDAKELRVKETDRIQTVAENLGRMGVKVETFEDGMHVPGNQTLHAAKLNSFGDHRIAMAFAVAALAADGPCEIEDAEAASVSFPEFYSLLARLTKSE
jgi:3-phosphoshikimate 1-carboxyvinyltransferase